MSEDKEKKCFEPLNGDAQGEKEVAESTEQLEKAKKDARKQAIVLKKNMEVFVRKLKAKA